MKLVPLFDRVVLKQLVAEETTKSGIVQTVTRKQRKSSRPTVRSTPASPLPSSPTNKPPAK